MLLNFQRNPLGTLMDLVHRYGDVLSYRCGPWTFVLINHPELVVQVLQDNHANYGKHSPSYKMLSWFLGDGLVTSDGEAWRRQRRLCQPAFQRRRLEALGPMMVSCTRDLVARWRQLPARQRLDASVETMGLTLRVVGLALFSQDLSRDTTSVGIALEEIQVQMGERFQSLFPLPPVLPTPRDRRFRASRERLTGLVLDIVQRRRQLREQPDDLLATLLAARDGETGDAMSDRQIRDELVTFLLAGHETTSNTLAWTFYLLSLHPAIRRRLEEEVDSALQGRPPAVEDLANMPLGERVIQESMRLYPAIWVYGRCSRGPDRLGGYSIPADQMVSISPYALHRHPDYWPNPEGFDPDRFLQTPVRGAYVPFAIGPRQCIGHYFSTLQARLILATIVQQVRLNLVPGARVEAQPLITLRPRGGVPVTLEFR